MKSHTIKIIRQVSKIAIYICLGFFLFVGLFLTYRAVKYRPYKVRISNVTDSAFTVSWITDEPMSGVVYYSEKNNFLPGPLSWIGKTRAVDDRDTAEAKTECVSKFNEEVYKTKDSNFKIEAKSFDCNEIIDVKLGQFYTHHVTIENLKDDTEYFFRVGNGYVSFKDSKIAGVEFIEREMSEISEFRQKTASIIKDVSSPNPAFGTTYSMYPLGDGSYIERNNFDSIIFLKTFKDDIEYPLMSAVSNSDGGWSIDLSNVRGNDGKPITIDGASIEFIPQVENKKPGASGKSHFEDTIFPVRLLGNMPELQVEEKLTLWSLSDKFQQALNKFLPLGFVQKGYSVDIIAPNKNNNTMGPLEYSGQDDVIKWYYENNKCIRSTDGCPKGKICYDSESECKKKNQTTTQVEKWFFENGGCKKSTNGCPSGKICYSSEKECNSKNPVSKVVVKWYFQNNKCIESKEGCPKGKVCFDTVALCEQENIGTCANVVAGKPIKGACEFGVSTCVIPYYPKTVGFLRQTEEVSQNNESQNFLIRKAIALEAEASQKLVCKFENAVGDVCGSIGCSDSLKDKITNGWTCEDLDGCICNTKSNTYIAEIKKGEICSSDWMLENKEIKSNEICKYPAGCNCTDIIMGSVGDVAYKAKCQPRISGFNCSSGENIKEGRGVLLDYASVCTYSQGCDCPLIDIVRDPEMYANKYKEDESANCGQACNPGPTEYGICYSTPHACEPVKVGNRKCNIDKSEYDTFRICNQFRNVSLAEVAGMKAAELRHCYKIAQDKICVIAKLSECYNSDGSLNDGYIGIHDTNSIKSFCKVVDPLRQTNESACMRAEIASEVIKKTTHYGIALLTGGMSETFTAATGAAKVALSVGTKFTGDFLENVSDDFVKDMISGDSCKPQYYCFRGEGEKDSRIISYDEARVAPYSCDFSKDAASCKRGRLDGVESCNFRDVHFCLEGKELSTGTHNQNESTQQFKCDSEKAKVVDPNSRIAINDSVCVKDKDAGHYVVKSLWDTVSGSLDVVRLIKDRMESSGQLGEVMAGLVDKTIKASEVASILGVDGVEIDEPALEDLVKSVSSWEGCIFGYDVLSSAPGEFIKRTYADGTSGQSNVVYFPTSGMYKIESRMGDLGLISPGESSVFFYLEKNGIEGYQSPVNPENPKVNEDVAINQAGLIIATSQETSAKKIVLKKGVNIVSFEFHPSMGEHINLTSEMFLKLANQSGRNVSRISYFSAGQWNGGTSYDFETGTTKGVPFDLGFGRGYIILAERDFTVSVPGYDIKDSIPLAFSSGWNLVGVHGQQEAYTAKTFIESINTIEGLKANNVTWWPTSRGMYQGYQLQNGQSYGQDFPISPLNGYFVRINEYTKDECKSIWWNPSGEYNGFCEK